jgi:3-oxoacyl-[acyl-carrier-protein] synthase II
MAPGWNGERTAVVMGTAFGCHATNEDYYRGVIAGGAGGGASPRLFAYTLPSSPVGEISIHYGIRGPASAVTSGRHAGVDALVVAARELEAGRADRALVCAAEVATSLLGRLIGAPVADASAALFVEREELAATRGARVRARLRSTASAYAAADRDAAVADAVGRALHDADLRPGDVTRVIATSGDAAALRALGVDAPAVDDAPEALGAAPLCALVRRLDEQRVTLLVAADPEGGAAAALFAPA